LLRKQQILPCLNCISRSPPELLGCLGAGVNRKYLVRSTKFVHVYLLGIHFLAFQGHLLGLLGRLGARVNRKYLVRSTKFVHFYLLGIHYLAFQGHLLELLGRLGAGANKKYLVRSTKFVHVYLLGIHCLAFQGHLLELLGHLGAGGDKKYLLRKHQILPSFNLELIFHITFCAKLKCDPLCNYLWILFRPNYMIAWQNWFSTLHFATNWNVIHCANYMIVWQGGHIMSKSTKIHPFWQLSAKKRRTNYNLY